MDEESDSFESASSLSFVVGPRQEVIEVESDDISSFKDSELFVQKVSSVDALSSESSDVDQHSESDGEKEITMGGPGFQLKVPRVHIGRHLPGPLRRLWELFYIGKFFLSVVVHHVHIVAIIQLVRIVQWFYEQVYDKETITYTAIILVSLLFLGYFAFDGVVNGNKYEVGVFVFSSLVLLLVVVIEFIVRAMPNDSLNGKIRLDPLDFVKLLLCAFCFCLYACLGPKISKEIAWRMYLRIGAKTQLRKMYARYQLFLTLWKQDLQFVVVIFSMWGPLGVFDPKTDYEFYMSFVGFGLSILLSLLTRFSIRHELGITFLVCAVLNLVEPLYVGFRTARFFEDPYKKYTLRKIPVRPFAAIAIVHILARFVLLFAAFGAFRNFGKGLKREVFQVRKQKRKHRKAQKRAEKLKRQRTDAGMEKREVNVEVD